MHFITGSVPERTQEDGLVYLITTEEEQAALDLCRAYTRLKELGLKDIAEFEPLSTARGFSAPFLGIELGGLLPIECEYDEAEDIFISLEDDKTGEDDEREVDLIMFRHYDQP
jgi:hypothetical protein